MTLRARLCKPRPSTSSRKVHVEARWQRLFRDVARAKRAALLVAPWTVIPLFAMRVVFLSPSYPVEMVHFTRGLAEVGAETYGVGDVSKEALPASVKQHLSHYLEVPRLLLSLIHI